MCFCKFVVLIVSRSDMDNHTSMSTMAIICWSSLLSLRRGGKCLLIEVFSIHGGLWLVVSNIGWLVSSDLLKTEFLSQVSRSTEHYYCVKTILNPSMDPRAGTPSFTFSIKVPLLPSDNGKFPSSPIPSTLKARG